MSSKHDALGLVLALHKLGGPGGTGLQYQHEGGKKKKFKVTLRNRVSTRLAPGYMRTLTSH